MHDSLTGRPVSGGLVLLESGGAASAAHISQFAVGGQAASGADGSFQLCASAVPSPSVVVAEALDASGSAYPAYVAPVSGSVALGVIAMGGCVITCGLPGQRQSSAPVTIAGTVTTDPVTETGSVTALDAVEALDGSKGVWVLAMGGLPANPEGQATFTTASGGCGGTGFCAPFRFVLPSQKPVVTYLGKAMQGTGAPVYAVAATLQTGSACVPATVETSFEADGGTPLTGVPGATVTAAPLQFLQCR